MCGSSTEGAPATMDLKADEYRARAVEYDRRAETLGRGNAAIRAYYGALAQHWRSLAVLAEDKTEREQSSPGRKLIDLPATRNLPLL